MKKAKILILIAAVVAAGASVTGLVLNTKQAKIKRFRKKAGMIVYNIGTALRILSCQCIDEQ
jgi:hypothetical protein